MFRRLDCFAGWVCLLSLHSLSSLASQIDLPFGDVNVVVLTDVHSWIGGHGRHPEENLNADYGDVLSFYERLKESSDKEGRDVWFVMNGDFVDGTGLSASPPASLVPLLEKMPWDAVNIGNHELYQSETVDFISRTGGFAHWFGQRYLTSNVGLASNKKPIGNRYHFLRGRHSTVLTFGFLYNMKNASPVVRVESVEKVVKSDWFQSVLHEDFDAIMVLAHMDVHDHLVDVILAAIREECGSNMPVQFITGHTHYRGFVELDAHSTSVEAGRYLDTVGFVSFPTKESTKEISNGNRTLFHHKFLDANVETLRKTLDVPKLKTESGADLSDFIHSTQEALGLRERLGCAPYTFYMSHLLHEADSLWGLYSNRVVPTQFIQQSSSKILFQSQGSIRYNLYKGNVTVDDVIAVDPFNDTVYLVAEKIPGTIVLELNEMLNAEESASLVGLQPSLPKYILAGYVSSNGHYSIYAQKFDAEVIKRTLGDIFSGEIVMEPTEVTTSSMWFSFVKEYWKCESVEVENEFSLKFSRPTKMMTRKNYSSSGFFVGAVFAVVLGAVLGVTRSGSRKQEYDPIV